MAENNVCIQVGKSVPDFKLTTYHADRKDFGEISLDQLKREGKWTILFFYPADFTFVCATEFAALAARYAQFRELGAEVITVSTDTQFVHLAWQREEKELSEVQYPMGADPTGQLARMFGVYDENSGLALRGTFIISPEGTLLNAEVNFYNLGRNVDELMRKVKANLYLGKNADEVCPASWQDEGDKTLRPGPEVVGRVHEALAS